MFRARGDLRVALGDVFAVNARFLVLRIRQREIDDRFADEAFKYARRFRRADKARDVVLVGMRGDDVFERTVRTELLYVRDDRTRRILA